MAIFYPDKATIPTLKIKPTNGEIFFLEFLEYLDDAYEIYFQPKINGDRPDIIILKKDCGLIIVEIKDWNPEYYCLNNGFWSVKRKKSIYKVSPFKQIETYKNNIFCLHIENLLERKINNPKIYSIISCIIYFHNAQYDFIEYIKNNENKRYVYNNNFFQIFSRDILTKENFDKTLSNIGFMRKSKFFDYDTYKKMQWLLNPREHTLENTKELFYDKGKQSELCKSLPKHQKIKGVAGSGKTLILAKRAVNAHKRTNGKILILTFNITLKNYIYYRINEIKEIFNWSNFTLNNYHDFISNECNNYEIPISLKSYEDLELFEDVKYEILKYSAIFIDEVQDYKENWLKMIKKYFLEKNGEFVVFGDEKQNIYNRTLDNEKKINTTIPGRWNELNESHRFKGKIIDLLYYFQTSFYQGKYEIDTFQTTLNSELNTDSIKIHYYYYINCNADKNTLDEVLIRTIQNITNTLLNIIQVTHSNICFIGNKTSLLRKVENIIKNNMHLNCDTTFVSKEHIDKIKNNIEIKNLEKSKKNNFKMDSGNIKISTTHSFKGWEAESIVLILNNENSLNNEPVNISNDYENNISTDELVYTGLTRCRQNLLILNINNNIYHDFFVNSEASKFIDKKIEITL